MSLLMEALQTMLTRTYGSTRFAWRSCMHKSPVELSHSVSAGIAGLLAGPLLFAPLSSIFGCSLLVFLGTLGALVCNSGAH